MPSPIERPESWRQELARAYLTTLVRDPDWALDQGRPRYGVAEAEILDAVLNETDGVCLRELASFARLWDLPRGTTRTRLMPMLGARRSGADGTVVLSEEKVPRVEWPAYALDGYTPLISVEVPPIPYHPDAHSRADLAAERQHRAQAMFQDIEEQARQIEQQVRQGGWRPVGPQRLGRARSQALRRSSRRLYRYVVCGFPYGEIVRRESSNDPDGGPHESTIGHAIRAAAVDLGIRRERGPIQTA